MPTRRLLRYRTHLLMLMGAGLLVLGLLLGPLSGDTIQAGTTKLSFETASTTVNSGDEFPAQVKIIGGSNVGGWESDLSFNPYLVRVGSVDFAPSSTFLQVNGRTAGALGPLNNPSDGTLALGGYSYGSNMTGATGDATLANVTLQALMPGTTPLNTDSGQIATPDAIGTDITGADAMDDSVTVNGTAKYIALGQTGTDYQSVLTMYNPTSSPISVGEVFVKADGALQSAGDSIPANGRKIVNLGAAGLSNDRFSTMLATNNSELVAELATHWKNYVSTPATSRTGTGAFLMRASTEAYTHQYFALGYYTDSNNNVDPELDNELVLFNPSLSQTANVTLYFTNMQGTVRSLTRTVAPGKRVSILMDTTLPEMMQQDYSTRVVSDVPVMAEMRYTYTKRNATGDGVGGYAMRGAPGGYRRQFFALGFNRLDPSDPQKIKEQWVNFLALYNYFSTPSTVAITYTKQLNGKPAGIFTKTLTLQPNQRYSYKVSQDPQMQNTDYSTEIVSSNPIIAEMAYLYDRYNDYIDKSDGYALRGAADGATTQYFAMGYTGPAGSTDEFEWVNYMAIVNPNPTDVVATITHYDNNGNTILSYSKTIAARGRLSWRVDLEPIDRLPMRQMENKSFSTKVTATQPVVAELALIYKNYGTGPLQGTGGGMAIRGDLR